MALPQTPPGGGDRRRALHFGYVKTFHGTNWHAWLAGPAHWFSCHTKGKTKPCLNEMTGGELTCERCALAHAVEVVGYVPLWRETDSKPVMVIVHEYTREVVDALKVHQRVTIGRGDEKSDGVYVVPALKPEPRFHTTLPEKMRPADLTETLLKVWGIPELATWYRQTEGQAPAPAPVPTPKKSDGKAFGPMHAAAARRYTGPAEPVAADLDDLMNRIKHKASVLPSTNGKHDPK